MSKKKKSISKRKKAGEAALKRFTEPVDGTKVINDLVKIKTVKRPTVLELHKNHKQRVRSCWYCAKEYATAGK